MSSVPLNDIFAAIKVMRSLSQDEWLFWEKVNTEGECWEWNAARTMSGYGVFSGQGKTRQAHRLAYTFATGEIIPDGMVVMHTCDNPLCVNPDHLILGSNADNNRDMHAKGRHKTRAKLTRSLIDEIRWQHSEGGIPHAQLVATYGVSMATILKITARSTRNRVQLRLLY